MTDGAHLGVSAGRALKTIVGGEPQPTEDEQVQRIELEKRIRSRRLPSNGPKPWEGVTDHDTEESDDAYSEAAEILAHCYLVLTDENPELLNKKLYYTEENCPQFESLWGKEQDPGSALWDAFTERWPDGDEWLGGLSGFMVGWAYNAVRFIREEPPAPNPAIVTVREPNDA